MVYWPLEQMQLPVVSRKTPCDTSQIQHFNYQGIAYVKIDVNVPFLEVLLNSRSPCRCRNIYTFADGWTTWMNMVWYCLMAKIYIYIYIACNICLMMATTGLLYGHGVILNYDLSPSCVFIVLKLVIYAQAAAGLYCTFPFYVSPSNYM